MFTFASPYYFLLLLPLAALGVWVYRPRTQAGIVFARAHQCRDQQPTWRTRMSVVLPAITLLGLTLIVVALARPRTVFSRMHRAVNALAIEVVVDMSGSMEALDLSEIAGGQIVKPRTRLDAVKELFAEFIRKRPDDLIGLVTFGGFASTRCPLTTDHNALQHILAGVQIPKPAQDASGTMVDQEELMTAIGDALATACARLRDAEPKSRIILLLSDGESNTGIIQPDEAAKLARKLGYKVYTIGIGTGGQAPFMARDMFGREVIQWADVALDEDLLKRIATQTGGKYFNVRDPKGLQRALDDIDALETTRIEREVYEQYREWFGFALLPGLALVALGCGLNMVCARRLV